ncbi:SDR family oxidoreductase [Dechloromonas sp. TW-R-39-2]|uniref:oxidoreductase n=1 Tax=Dechloromonas sp. TW-R-39-2 TaxID=2654218 RepID=UPI00193E8A39|nr:oxidoreductase [Dechloromonas sp. TW-R-39-2]QRM20152.1 SDR family oxidoreductase [Dechloromonas sp. TW-R-39-2]
MKSLDNALVVVAGGAGLLGRSFVRAIAENGGRVVVADIDIQAAEKLVAELDREFPARVYAASLDITQKASIGSLIDDLQCRYGTIDALVNNSYPRNKNYGRKIENVTYDDFCENVNLHLGGYFLVAQQFCMVFKAQGHGNVINMSSIYGSIAPRFEVYEGTPMTMPVEYAAIKSAVVHLTRYFAQYFKGAGIRVNCLSPGGIRANQHGDFLAAYNAHCASKGMLDPGDIVGALLFLLSDESRYITGQNLLVDDGFSL